MYACYRAAMFFSHSMIVCCDQPKNLPSVTASLILLDLEACREFDRAPQMHVMVHLSREKLIWHNKIIICSSVIHKMFVA